MLLVSNSIFYLKIMMAMCKITTLWEMMRVDSNFLPIGARSTLGKSLTLMVETIVSIIIKEEGSNHLLILVQSELLVSFN